MSVPLLIHTGTRNHTHRATHTAIDCSDEGSKLMIVAILPHPQSYMFIFTSHSCFRHFSLSAFLRHTEKIQFILFFNYKGLIKKERN
jgi:hypothetical protein